MLNCQEIIYSKALCLAFIVKIEAAVIHFSTVTQQVRTCGRQTDIEALKLLKMLSEMQVSNEIIQIWCSKVALTLLNV